MAVYDKDGNNLDSIYDAFGNRVNVSYDIYGNIVYTNTYMSIGTIGCGSILSIVRGSVEDIGDGDTSYSIQADGVTANLVPLSEVKYE